MSLSAYINLMLVAQGYDFDFCIGLAGEIRSESAVVSCEGEVLLLYERQFVLCSAAEPCLNLSLKLLETEHVTDVDQ